MEFRRITGLPPYVFTIIDGLKVEARRAVGGHSVAGPHARRLPHEPLLRRPQEGDAHAGGGHLGGRRGEQLAAGPRCAPRVGAAGGAFSGPTARRSGRAVGRAFRHL